MYVDDLSSKVTYLNTSVAFSIYIYIKTSVQH